jgi:hypothetical protein
LLRTTSSVDRTTTASCGLWPWIELARRRNLDIERVCTRVGIELSRLRQPFARWPQSTCNRLAQLACDEFGDGAAMAAAQTVEAGHFQLLELLIRTAPSVGDGLRLGCRFFPLLHDGGELVHERLRSGAHVVTWLPPSHYTVHHAYVELTFGVTVGGIRREASCEHAAATEVSLRRPDVRDATDYERALGCVPSFGRHEDRIVFDRRVAALGMVRRNPEVHEKARILAQELIGSDELQPLRRAT